MPPAPASARAALLIVGEVALSLVLLMGAGVMLRSLLALRNVDAGFKPRGVLTMDVNLPETRYSTPAQRGAFFDTLLERVRALPGVESAGVVDTLPVTGGGSVAADRRRGTRGAAAERSADRVGALRRRPAT